MKTDKVLVPKSIPILDPDFEFRETDKEIVDAFLLDHPDVVYQDEPEWEE